MKTVVYKNQKIQLDEKNALGSGGEAIVIQKDNLAFKIYHNPSQQRSEKLKDFLNLKVSLPNNVAAPIDLIFNTNSEIIGFTMLIAKNCKEAIHLSNKKFRSQEQISPNEIITFFLHLHSTLNQIHSNKLIIGDFNDLNALYNDKFLSVFIDVDSFQFGKYPCFVGTDQFIDPSLYGVDLSTKPYFSIATDWYSYVVMIFKCLLLAHPYGGMHKKYQTLIDRAINKIDIFDKDVIYPKIAFKPEILSDEILDFFNKTFKLGQKNQMPLQLLKNLDGQFSVCLKCNTSFYNGRKQCPICFKPTISPTIDISQIVTTHKTDDDKCLSDILFLTEGTILYSKILVDKRIIVIDYANKETKLHVISDKEKLTFKLWNNHIRDVKFDFFKNYLVVAINDELMIFEVLKTLRPIEKTTTKKFNNELMFSCSEDKLYRLTEQVISFYEIYNNQLAESIVTQILENQTWFEVGLSNVGIGYFRTFDQYHYFVFSHKGRFDVEIPKHEGKIIETFAEFSESTVLLLQKTLFKGRTYSRYFLIDIDGKILSLKTEESISSETLKNLQGKVLLGSVIFHPTDNGIVIEKNNQLVLKSETEKYINSNNRLFIYKDGLLVISEHNINFLRLVK